MSNAPSARLLLLSNPLFHLADQAMKGRIQTLGYSPQPDGRGIQYPPLKSAHTFSDVYREIIPATRESRGSTPMTRDSQVIELLGRNLLVAELLQAGLEVALPIRDRGIDLVDVPTFTTRGICHNGAGSQPYCCNTIRAVCPRIVNSKGIAQRAGLIVVSSRFAAAVWIGELSAVGRASMP